jgi:hypothetical protein
MFAAVAAFTQPPHTTIQDTLYKADGTPFTGFAHHFVDLLRR